MGKVKNQENLPFHTVRRILKTHIKADVTKEYVEFVKTFLEELIQEIANASIQELDKVNQLRSIQNMPKLKRIDSSIFKNFVEQIFKSTSNFNSGEVAETSRNTTLSEAVEVA